MIPNSKLTEWITLFPVAEYRVSRAVDQQISTSENATYAIDQFARLHLSFARRVGNLIFRSLTIITLMHIRAGTNEIPMDAIVTPDVPLTGRLGPLSEMYQIVLPTIAPRMEIDTKNFEAFLLSIPPRLRVANKKEDAAAAR
jgi:hypothetical protein